VLDDVSIIKYFKRPSKKSSRDLVVTRMSKHATTFLAREPVQVLVNQHVIVETVLPGECGVADQADKWLYACNKKQPLLILCHIPQKRPSGIV